MSEQKSNPVQDLISVNIAESLDTIRASYMELLSSVIDENVQNMTREIGTNVSKYIYGNDMFTYDPVDERIRDHVMADLVELSVHTAEIIHVYKYDWSNQLKYIDLINNTPVSDLIFAEKWQWVENKNNKCIAIICTPTSMSLIKYTYTHKPRQFKFESADIHNYTASFPKHFVKTLSMLSQSTCDYSLKGGRYSRVKSNIDISKCLRRNYIRTDYGNYDAVFVTNLITRFFIQIDKQMKQYEINPFCIISGNMSFYDEIQKDRNDIEQCIKDLSIRENRCRIYENELYERRQEFEKGVSLLKRINDEKKKNMDILASIRREKSINKN